jgi:WD40 repeat protein
MGDVFGPFAFSPDGKEVVFTGRELVFLDAQTGVVLRKEKLTSYGRGVLAWRAKDNHLVCFDENVPFVCDLTGKKRLLSTLPASGLRAVAASQRYVYVYNYYQDLGVADLESEKKLPPVKLEDPKRTLYRHLAAHPQLPQVALTDHAGTLRVYDAVAGELLWKAHGHTPRRGYIYTSFHPVYIAYDPTGKWLASAGNDGTVRLWHADTGKSGPVLDLGIPSAMAVAWGPDELLAVACADATVRVYQRGKLLHRLAFSGTLYEVQIGFSPDGQILMVQPYQSLRPTRWEVKSGTLLSPKYEHAYIIDNLTWLGNQRLHSTDRVGETLTWDLSRGCAVAKHSPEPYLRARSADGQRAAFYRSYDNVIEIRDKGKKTATLASPLKGRQFLDQAAFNPQGDLFAALIHPAAIDGKRLLCVWDVSSGKLLASMKNDQQSYRTVMKFHWKPDGKQILLAAFSGIGLDQDTELTLYEAATLKKVKSISQAPLLALTLDVATNRDKVVLSTYSLQTRKSTIQIWDLNPGTKAPLRVWPSGLRTAWLARFSPCGRMIASAGASETHQEVVLWEARTAREIHRWKIVPVPQVPSVNHLQDRTVAFSPDGKRLATTGHAPTIFVWDVTLGRLRPDGTLTPLDLQPDLLERCWQQLAEPDPAIAYQAAWQLAASPAQAVPFLAKRLRPLVPPHPQQFQTWLNQLNDEDFATRQKASEELAAYGPGALACIEAVREMQDLEVQRRLTRIVAGWMESPEELRTDRALFALEQMGVVGRPLLQRMASGVPEAEHTQLARQALKRDRGISPR